MFAIVPVLTCEPDCASSADAIVGKTPDGVVVSWNPAAEHTYGYTVGGMLGRDMSWLVPQRSR